jgi:hypothetical protein
MKATKIEVQKPNDRTMQAAIESVKPDYTTMDSIEVIIKNNGAYVTFILSGFTGLEMFKIGRIYQNLLMQ